MVKRRALKSATADPPASKRRVSRVTVAENESQRDGSGTRKVGFVVVAAAVTVGFVGGWLARRWLGLI
jgi:hypothetical protein